MEAGTQQSGSAHAGMLNGSVELRTVASALSEVPRYPPYEARVQAKSISYDVNHKASSGQTLNSLFSGTRD